MSEGAGTPTAHLDAVTSPRLDSRVVAAMAPFVGARPSSPSGLHEWALAPAETLERARAEVAALLGSDDPDTVIFTASAMEARNLAVKGLATGNAGETASIVTSAIEHAAVRDAVWALERWGAHGLAVGVDGEGRIDPSELAAHAGDTTALVSIHHGHEDIGVVQDVGALATAVRAISPEARIHVDAGASAGLVALDVEEAGCDAVSIGGPSLGAPPWCGALWVRPGARLRPLIGGGAQELGKRAGPECVPAIAALGAAAAIAREEMSERAGRLAALGHELMGRLLAVPGTRLNGPREDRLPGNVHVSVDGVDGEALAASLAARGVAVAAGSACTQDAGKESPVLIALGRDPESARSSVLFSLDDQVSEDEIAAGAAAFAAEVERLRALAPDATPTGR